MLIIDRGFTRKFYLCNNAVKVGAGSSSSQTQGYSESSSYNYQAVPLLRSDEVMRLSKEVNLIMRTGNAQIKAGQFVWYKEQIM